MNENSTRNFTRPVSLSERGLQAKKNHFMYNAQLVALYLNLKTVEKNIYYTT